MAAKKKKMTYSKTAMKDKKSQEYRMMKPKKKATKVTKVTKKKKY